MLTRQGKLYLDYVEKALESLEEGRSALQRMQTELDQRIDIGFVSSLQARMMPQLLADYRKTTGSQTRFACYEGTTVTLLEQLEEGTLDLALGSEPQDSVRFDRIRCSVRELVVLTPKTPRWQAVSSLSLEQIAAQPLILHTRNTGMRKIVLDLFDEAGLKPNVAEEATEESMIASLVAMELGVAVVSLSPAVQLPTVHIVKLDHPKKLPVYPSDLFTASLFKSGGPAFSKLCFEMGKNFFRTLKRSSFRSTIFSSGKRREAEARF